MKKIKDCVCDNIARIASKGICTYIPSIDVYYMRVRTVEDDAVSYNNNPFVKKHIVASILRGRALICICSE